jgi:hypothetical protein
MTEALSKVTQIIDDPQIVHDVIRREVPMLASDWGARDEDALLHTLGINLFAGLGRAVGYVGLSEFPVPRAEKWEHKLVRVDSAWFDLKSRRPVVLVEFERFSMDTVQEKLRNLYVAARGCEIAPDVLVLCIWALDGDSVDTRWFNPNKILTVSGGPSVRRPHHSSVILIQAVIGRHADSMHFLSFRRLP